MTAFVAKDCRIGVGNAYPSLEIKFNFILDQIVSMKNPISQVKS